MQQRRLRPGDVLDDYCPRERRITDHAIVAMIDDHIKQTRCVVCDAEHEYKQARVPPQRRKKPALFNQVLEGLKAPAAPPHLPDEPALEPEAIGESATAAARTAESPNGDQAPAIPEAVAAAENAEGPPTTADEVITRHDEGPVRRQLIRAALPRPEGTPAPTRAFPEFTIRQPGNGRGRHGRRRGQHQKGGQGSMRFGRGGHGQRQGQRGMGHGNSGRRRGGKKR